MPEGGKMRSKIRTFENKALCLYFYYKKKGELHKSKRDIDEDLECRKTGSKIPL